MSEKRIPYEVRHAQLTGKHRVYYKCPACVTDLHNPIEHAGSEDLCPECGMSFVVPGADARQWIQEKSLEAEQERRERQRKRQEERAKQSAQRTLASRAREAEAQQRAAQAVQLSRTRVNPDGPCFPRYWTPSIVRATWMVALGLGVLFALSGVLRTVGSLVNGDDVGARVLVYPLVTVASAAVWLVLVRLALEMCGVLFDILGELRHANQMASDSDSPGE